MKIRGMILYFHTVSRVALEALIMRVEMMVQKDKLPKNGLSLITVELEKRLHGIFPDAKVRVRAGTSNRLDIYAHKDKKTLANNIVEQAFNEADEWLFFES